MASDSQTSVWQRLTQLDDRGTPIEFFVFLLVLHRCTKLGVCLVDLCPVLERQSGLVPGLVAYGGMSYNTAYHSYVDKNDSYVCRVPVVLFWLDRRMLCGSCSSWEIVVCGT